MSSYRQILKSSSIVGGAQAASLILGMVRTKLVALLLGPSGVGLIGLYDSVINVSGTLTNFGIASSAVRQVAEADASGEKVRVGQTVRALRRVCWLTGALGLVLMVVLSKPLSVWTFGGTSRSGSIAILSITLLLTAISSGQSALIRGVRRIGDLARMQVVSAIANLLLSVVLYAWLGETGIVPVFILAASINLGFSWWFARRVPVPPAMLDWRTTRAETMSLVRLGLAFVVSAFLSFGGSWITRAWIQSSFGLHGNGIYQAAWAISGVFGGFVLSAMGMDFYPRLTAIASDNAKVSSLVNEQTEIGVLLALPGLLATIVFSPWVIRILYSTRFEEAAVLLPWFVIGVFGRVISWPLGFIMLAKGAARWYTISEVTWATLQICLTWLFLRLWGLEGVSIAFAALYACCTPGVLWIANRLTHFRWTSAVMRLLLVASLLMVIAFFLARFCGPVFSALVGAPLVTVCGVGCVRRICLRLGRDHRLTIILGRVPLFSRFLPTFEPL